MNTNIDFKKLWNKQETEIPEIAALFKKANQLKRNNLYKLIASNIILALTSIFIGFIWYYYQPELLTTKIGIVLVITAMILFLAVYNKIIPLLLKSNVDINNKQYLQQLLKLKEKQLFLQTTMLNIYFVLLSLGIGLYLFEYASRMTLTWAVFSYGIIFLWIAGNWLYIRPKAIKKQQAKMNKLICKFKDLEEQCTY